MAAPHRRAGPRRPLPGTQQSEDLVLRHWPACLLSRTA